MKHKYIKSKRKPVRSIQVFARLRRLWVCLMSAMHFVWYAV